MDLRGVGWHQVPQSIADLALASPQAAREGGDAAGPGRSGRRAALQTIRSSGRVILRIGS